jgi:hypothetical protein
MRRHLVVSTGTLIAVMVLLSACGSSSKSSAPSDTSSPTSANALTCTALTASLTLAPPVSPTVSETHKINVAGKLSGCTGTPGITSGDLTVEVNMKDKLNCAELISYTTPNRAVLSVTWNDGSRSTGSGFLVTFQDVTKFLISGRVTAGSSFVGKTATAQTVNTPEGGGCISGGASLGVATLALAPGTELEIG